jgi:hypothetical protein
VKLFSLPLECEFLRVCQQLKQTPHIKKRQKNDRQQTSKISFPGPESKISFTDHRGGDLCGDCL